MALVEPRGSLVPPPHNLSRHIYGDMWRVTYPHSGHLFVFRGKNASLLKILFWDGTGLCLFTKRIDRGNFFWLRLAEPGSSVTLSPAQLAMLLEGIDWRTPERFWRPILAG